MVANGGGTSGSSEQQQLKLNLGSSNSNLSNLNFIYNNSNMSNSVNNIYTAKQINNNNNCNNNNKETTTGEMSTKSDELPTENNNVVINNNFQQRSSSFKKFRESSLKQRAKQKPKRKSESDVLNNGREHSQCNGSGSNPQQPPRKDSTLARHNRIQNDTKSGELGGSCNLTPENSVRSKSASRRNSYAYKNINRQATEKNYQRRLSSIEQRHFEKVLHQKLSNYEDQVMQSFEKNSKNDVSKLDKSLSNINVSENSQTPHSLPPPQREHHVSKIKLLLHRLKPEKFTAEREDFSLYIFAQHNR